MNIHEGNNSHIFFSSDRKVRHSSATKNDNKFRKKKIERWTKIKMKYYKRPQIFTGKFSEFLSLFFDWKETKSLDWIPAPLHSVNYRLQAFIWLK